MGTKSKQITILYGLRAHFIVRMVLFALIFGGLATFLTLRWQSLTLLQDKKEAAVFKAETIAMNSKYAFITADSELLAMLLEPVKNDLDILFAAVVDQTIGTKVLAEYNTLDYPLVESTNIHETATVTVIERGGLPYIEVVAPIYLHKYNGFENDMVSDLEHLLNDQHESAPVGYVQLGFSLKIYTAKLQELKWKIVSFIFVSILFFSVYFYIQLTKEVLLPLKSFITGTEHVGKGNLNFKINVTKKNEIGELQEAFNKSTAKRNTAERKLKRLATAVDQTADMIIITDSQGLIQYVNPTFEKITGYTQNELEGHTCNVLKSGKQDKLFYRELWQTISSGQVWRGHFINKTKKGDLYEEETTISPIFSTDERIVSYVAVKQDVTQKVLMERHLRQKQKLEALGDLAGGISHDFNNILLGINAYVSMIADLALYDQEIQDYLNGIKEATTRADDMIKQIMSFQHPGKKKITFSRLDGIIKEVTRLIAVSLPPEIEIQTKIESEGHVFADATQLHQVFMNICTNAVHAMEQKGGVINILLTDQNLSNTPSGKAHLNLKEGEYCKVSISDNGAGMSKEVLERIFDPFFTTKSKGKGSGIGLSVVHGIVTGNHGAISVESDQGKGTTFHIYLPLIEMPESIEEKKEIKRILPQSDRILSSERILLVDDDEDYSQRLKAPTGM